MKQLHANNDINFIAGREFKSLKAGDILQNGHSRYQVGSVASSCIADNRCPIKGIKRAQDNRHDLHFIFALCSVIANSPVDRHVDHEVAEHDVFYFEGHAFRIARSMNNNLRFVELNEQEIIDELVTFHGWELA